MTVTQITRVDHDAQRLTEAEARAATDQIKGALIVAHDLLIECFHGRADQALGYLSWDAYCATEFAEARMIRLSREQRQEIVAAMRSEGMSTRAIGSALGISPQTVTNDRLSTFGQSEPVATITSLDGRQRPAVQPDRPMTAAEINAITPPEMIAEARAESERAGPAFGIRMALDDLLKEPDAETVVRDLPDYAREQLDRVPEALAYLTALNQAMETYL